MMMAKTSAPNVLMVYEMKRLPAHARTHAKGKK